MHMVAISFTLRITLIFYSVANLGNKLQLNYLYVQILYRFTHLHREITFIFYDK